MSDIIDNSPLGKDVEYSFTYNPGFLCPIRRRSEPESPPTKNFCPVLFGWDIWTAYELAWLDLKGKPRCAVAYLIFPSNSENIIESKSLKLYLNSLTDEKFKSMADVKKLIIKDLSAASNSEVKVEILEESSFLPSRIGQLQGTNIDNEDVEITQYTPDKNLLALQNKKIVVESLYSNLFKSNCPVTGQPDWASIQISYKGKTISRKSLLKYLVSYRKHAAFHESCAEEIFCDIMEICHPELLTVYARFTRRGGLDINPIRTNDKTVTLPELKFRLFRQ